MRTVGWICWSIPKTQPGIETAKIETEGYAVDPQRKYEKNGPGQITGYRVRNHVSVWLPGVEDVAAEAPELGDPGDRVDGGEEVEQGRVEECNG